jgi:hypothetical protein
MEAPPVNRSLLSLLAALALLAVGCQSGGSIGDPVPDDDDSVAADDDDATPDDDDATPDDDDATPDDDDVVVDDDDVVVDDDDVVVDDDDVVVDDDDVVVDDDDSVVVDDDDSVVVDDDDSVVVDDDDVVVDDDDVVLPTCPSDFLACDGPLSHTWSNAGLGSTSDMNGYSCVSGAGHTGPEYHYAFTAPADGDFTVETTGTSADLDVYILEGSDCDETACVEDGSSGNGNEDVSFQASAGDTFVIVVDGWNGAISDYTITLSCDLDQADDDDSVVADDDDSAVVDDDDSAVLDDDDSVVVDDDDVVATDNDNDGYPTPEDCNDANPAIHPDAAELCDLVDNDCDGAVDDAACPGCTQASYGGHTYQFCDDFPLDWQDADWACSAYGYELVTVDGEAENDFLGLHAGSGNWWIGFNDRGGWSAEGNFVWSGAPSTTGYTNWHAGEPNNAGPSWQGGEDCGEIRAGFGWQWNDAGCGTAQAFVCEAG